MDAGLDNARALRLELLPPELRTQDKFDVLFAELGRGVMAEMESYLGRKLPRLEDAEMVTTANREHVVVERWPIEGTPEVSVKPAGEADWEAIDVENTLSAAGMVLLGGIQGGERDLLKVVWTGGYWVDTSDAGDGELPEGAEAVPEALRHAWVMQCAHEAEQRRIVGGEMLVQTESGAAVRLGPDKIGGLLAVVKATIKPWQRMT